MPILSHMPAQATHDADEIAHWRLRVFSFLMPVMLVLGTFSAAGGAALAANLGDWQTTMLRALTLAWVFAVWRLERAAYALRVYNFLAAVFLTCAGLLAEAGPAALVCLMTVPVMAVILLGMRPAIGAIALCAATLLLTTADGRIQLHTPGLEHDPPGAAMLATLNFVCVGILLVLASATLLEGLSRSLGGARRAARELGRLNHDMRMSSEAIARLNDMVLIARTVDTPGAALPIIFANDAALRHTGYARDEVVGHSVRMFEGPDTDPATIARLIDAVQRKQAASAEIVHYKKSGEAYWVAADLVPFADDDGAITHWLIVGRDVTERRNAAADIHRLAHYDGLTGLANRRLLLERLAAMLAGAASGHAIGALLHIDLDHFKTINDARGHATGDLVLTHAADRLALMAGQHGTVARLGGDEFVVLLDALGPDPDAAAGHALAQAEAIRGVLSAPMDIDDQRHFIGASIGVTLATHGRQSVHDLLREGDIAMYRAKALGRNGVALFAPAMLEEAEQRLALERGLAHALEHGELALHLQLQVDAQARPCGAEMLMRWQRADGSQVPPDVFIPVAESSGQIVAIGEWALRQTCLAWLALRRAGHALPLSVNVSPVQFRQPDFVARVEAILLDTGMPPGQLIIEITEGLLVDRYDRTIDNMHRLATLGIRFSIDDFGTGYSSLGYLTSMPLYELKIDRSFIHGTPDSGNATAIVQSVLAMARHLGLRVVAEGVETASQADWLAAHGNASMQGHLFHRPMPLDAVLARLAAPFGSQPIPA